MAPKHGITVHAGSNFARPKYVFSPRLSARASVPSTATISLIVTAVILVVCGIFCCGVGLLWCKSKRNKQKRARKFQDSRPFVQNEYSMIDDVNVGTHTSSGDLHELSHENQAHSIAGQRPRFELQADSMAQHLDGFAAPPRVNTRPVELASNEAYQLPALKAQSYQRLSSAE